MHPDESTPSAAASETVGLDIGGTKTHGVLWRGTEVVAEAKAGSANVQNVSGDEARENLRQLFKALGGRNVTASPRCKGSSTPVRIRSAQSK